MIANFGMGDSGSMVNELLIQMQSFDQPPLRTRMQGKFDRLGERVPPPDRQLPAIKSEYHNILLIAATNRGDSLDPALRPPRPVRPSPVLRRAHEAGPRAT